MTGLFSYICYGTSFYIMPISESMHLYEVFGKYFGNNEDAKAVVHSIVAVSENKIRAMERIFLTKDDKVDLIREMKSDKAELIGMMKSGHADLIREMKSDKAELIDRIGRAKLETICWIVGLGIIQIVLILFSRSLA